MPYFSVVIPLYNKENLVEQTIRSLHNQSFTDFEAIIVNDGSTDKSLEKITPLIDTRFKIVSQKNQGVSQARNVGIDLAKGNYIALLDADDFWYKDHLFELKKLITLFPRAGLFCNNYEISFDNKLVKPATFNFNYENNPLIVKDYFKSSTINSVSWTSSVAFKKFDFDKIGKFNLDLITGQDIDLWIRFALNYKVAFNPSITMRYNNFTANSLSKSEYNNDRYLFINKYKGEELKNPSLKLYLDVNRYAVALRCKMNDEQSLYEKLKKEIDFNSLNLKQKILLNCPKAFLRSIKKFQSLLMKNNIYLNAYK